MTSDDDGVTLPEVNRNVNLLRQDISNLSKSFVPLTLWEENRTDVGRRVGAIENELAEKRHALTNSLIYPLLIMLIGLALGAGATHFFV